MIRRLSCRDRFAPPPTGARSAALPVRVGTGDPRDVAAAIFLGGRIGILPRPQRGEPQRPAYALLTSMLPDPPFRAMQDMRFPEAGPVADALVVRDAALSALPGVRHGFFGRRGGTSDGIFESLNVGLGSGDAPEHVAANRARVAATLGVSPDRLLTPFQVHSPTAVIVEAPFGADERPRADALVTNTPGLAVGVLTADCGPLLFVDPDARVAAAAHAGWRGATGGVIEATLDAMERCGAVRTRVVAALGPTITAPSYEVDAAMANGIVSNDAAAAPFFSPGAAPEKRQFDLPGLILMRLRRAGVARVAFDGRCTYAGEADHFSFRRATHRGEPDYGRQVAAVVLS